MAAEQGGARRTTGGRAPILIIGAGPAGLATAAELTRTGVPYRLFERGPSFGHCWRSVYDSLVLHTGRHMSTLPGMRYPRGTPLFPRREDFLGYLDRYVRRNGLVVEGGHEIATLAPNERGWVATAGDGEVVEGSGVVVATGLMSNPLVPSIAGRAEFGGRVLHSVEYRRPAEFVGRKVLVVGVGNSGGEIGAELARAGAKVTVLVRTGANVIPRDLAGIPMQYLAWLVRRLPNALQGRVLAGVQQIIQKRRGEPVIPRKGGPLLASIPIIGFHLVDAIKDGAARLRMGELTRFTPTGVVFGDGEAEDFDVVLWATGFAPALAALGGLVRTDPKGFALRSDRVTSADQARLWFVGHNYDVAGGLANIRMDAGLVAEAAGASLRA